MYLVNGGLQRRCYTYIKDATDAHLRIIENAGGLCDRQIFNVGVPTNETTIRDLALAPPFERGPDEGISMHLDVQHAKSYLNKAWSRLRQRFQPAEQAVVDDFHKLFFASRRDKSRRARWLGVPLIKYPDDLFVFQEMIHELRPDLIVETGTSYGGSALFFASMCDLVGGGRVVTVDIEPKPDRPIHPRITYVEGSSIGTEAFAAVCACIEPGDRVMVFLDSSHRKEHVLQELQLFSDLVTIGSYLVVEDTKLNGHPVYTHYEPDVGPGPMEALAEFLQDDRRFSVDRSREKFLLTSNPGGFLRREA